MQIVCFGTWPPAAVTFCPAPLCVPFDSTFVLLFCICVQALVTAAQSTITRRVTSDNEPISLRISWEYTVFPRQTNDCSTTAAHQHGAALKWRRPRGRSGHQSTFQETVDFISWRRPWGRRQLANGAHALQVIKRECPHTRLRKLWAKTKQQTGTNPSVRPARSWETSNSHNGT